MTRTRSASAREHERFRQLAAAAVDGWIHPDDASDLDAHLASCPTCRADQRAMIRDHAWLATPRRLTAPDPRVRALILDAARAPRVPRVGQASRPWAALLAAGLVVALVGAGVSLSGRALTGPGAQRSASPGSVPSASPLPSVAAGECAPPPPDLSSWWPFDGTGQDLRGGYDLALRSGASFGPGLVGSALILDGRTGYAEDPDDSIAIGQGDFTIMLWVRFDSLAGEQVLIETWHDSTTGSGPDQGWTLTKLDGNSLSLVIAFTRETLHVDTQPLPVQAGAWYHIAARRTGAEVSILVDGQARARSSVPPDPYVPPMDAHLLLGRRGDDRGLLFHGALDEVQIVLDRGLFESDIRAQYLAGSTGACPG